jgi:hypothetical protein
MTQKELLYLMDIVNHLKRFTENLNCMKCNLSDESSKQLVKAVIDDAKGAYDEYTGLILSGGNC